MKRELSDGKHAAITASPASRVLQYMDSVSTSDEHNEIQLEKEKKIYLTHDSGPPPPSR